MNGPIDFPHDPKPFDLWLFRLQTTNLRRVPYAVGALVIAGLLIAAAILFGFTTPQYPTIDNVDDALPQSEWPEMTGPASAAIFGSDGSDETLGPDQLRERLFQIDANANRLRDGEKVELIEDTRPALEDQAAGLASPYWEWVDGAACSMSGWSGESRGHVAALVRNGVWDCAEWQQTLSSWPMVVSLGLWPGLALTILLLVLLGFIIYRIVLLIRRTERIFRLHSRLYSSWIA